ncbi:MAG: hypothetical protein C4K58_04115 [Flavobacteriaceae bacterium]|nr:MAG: hypothetical protein C4K58_04115 [Flavobacteriaceae bacterium]
MKSLTTTFLGLALLASVASCKKSTEQNEAQTIQTPPLSNCNGTFQGVLPCADCAGIDTTLTLNLDQTFQFVTAYQGKPGKPFEETGTFTIEADVVTLNGKSGFTKKFGIEGRNLVELDLEGKKIETQANVTLFKM